MTAADATFLYVDIAVLLGVLGLLMILAGWAAAKGRLKRNYVVGMRTSAIMRSDDTWRVAHKKCAWSFWSSGGVLVAGALLLNVLRPPGRWSTTLLMVMTALVGVIVFVGAVQAARTVDHEAPGQDRT